MDSNSSQEFIGEGIFRFDCRARKGSFKSSFFIFLPCGFYNQLATRRTIMCLMSSLSGQILPKYAHHYLPKQLTLAIFLE